MAERLYLGIDTSNYTSSCAVYQPSADVFVLKKQILSVGAGQVGLRQSDAVFQHTKNLPPLLSELCRDYGNQIETVSYSYAPRDVPGSYMPCFCVGEGFARVLSASFSAKLHKFSHQAGHIAAAMWSAKTISLRDKPFLAFHISGGTTDLLLVKPEKTSVFQIDTVASSLDLKAGQAVDRVGVMLSLPFPAGPALEALSNESDRQYRVKPFMKDGCCSFSGVENQCGKMLKNGEKPCDIARYCLDYICAAVAGMTAAALKTYGNLPLLYAGGVMSNARIRSRISREFGGSFAEPLYSSDNAAGTAYLGFLKENYR